VAEDTGGDGGTGIDTTVPHSARIWNYWLGGKDNYAVDRMAGDQTIAGIVRALLAAVPAGSYLALTHSTSEVSGERVIEAVRQWNQVAPTPYTLRSPAQIAVFFDGLKMVEPGLVPCPRWRPDPGDAAGARDMDGYCGLGRK
jgi:hypothetical protein